MKLKEYLQSTDPDCMYFIGGRPGKRISVSSWAFIGPIDEFWQSLEKLDAYQKQVIENRIKHQKKNLRLAVANIARCYEDNDLVNLATCAAAANLAAETLIEAKDLKSRWEGLLECSIKETYPEKAERRCSPYKSGECIILTFPIVGRFWLRSEYVTGKVEGKVVDDKGGEGVEAEDSESV